MDVLNLGQIQPCYSFMQDIFIVLITNLTISSGFESKNISNQSRVGIVTGGRVIFSLVSLREAACGNIFA